MRKHSYLVAVLASGLMMTAAYAEKIQSIRIEGNKRIESESVKSYIPLKEGDEYTQEKMNEAIKELFAKGYFVDVKFHKQGGTLVIHVMENAIINRIAFEGNSKINDDRLNEESLLRPREVLSHSKVRAAQQRLMELYRKLGRYAAKIEPKIIELDEGRVDLVFEIEEGDATYIRKINFVGNNHIGSNKLESAILSRVTRWYRFFADDDVFDSARFEADKQLLRQYYLNSGYPDYQLKSAVAELSPDGRDFYLTFTLDEGEPYNFGKVNVSSEIEKIRAEDYTPYLEFSEGDRFSAKRIEKSLTGVTEAIGSHGYAFADVQPDLIPNPESRTVDLNINIKQGPMVYVERIDVIGNDRTRDHVIRRELQLHEGDAFNATLLRKSEKRIRDLGYFKAVDISVKTGSAPDKAVIVVRVEEQPTGEMSLAAGYGTVDGILGKVGFTERNFMGKGQIINTEVSVAKRHQEFVLGMTEPYFMGKPLLLGGQVYVTRSSRFNSYRHITKGVQGTFGYDLSENLSHAWNYDIHQDRMSDMSTNSPILQLQSGRSTTSSIGHTLTYDRRDSKVEPTKGYAASLNNVYAGMGGNVFYFKTVATGHFYYTPVEDVTCILKGSYGRMEKIGGEPIRVVDSFMLGADTLRGFEYGGVGPRDSRGGDALGGTRYWTTSFDVLFPIGLPNDLGIKGAVFADAGNVWRTGARTTENINTPGGVVPESAFVTDIRKVRASVGFGLSWSSPFGPLRIDYAFPIRRAKNDNTQRVLFGFSTRF